MRDVEKVVKGETGKWKRWARERSGERKRGGELEKGIKEEWWRNKVDGSKL